MNKATANGLLQTKDLTKFLFDIDILDWEMIGFRISYSSMLCSIQVLLWEWFDHPIHQFLIGDYFYDWASWYEDTDVWNDPTPNKVDTWFGNTLAKVVHQPKDKIDEGKPMFPMDEDIK